MEGGKTKLRILWRLDLFGIDVFQPLALERLLRRPALLRVQNEKRLHEFEREFGNAGNGRTIHTLYVVV